MLLIPPAEQASAQQLHEGSRQRQQALTLSGKFNHEQRVWTLHHSCTKAVVIPQIQVGADWIGCPRFRVDAEHTIRLYRAVDGEHEGDDLSYTHKHYTFFNVHRHGYTDLQ